MAWCNLSHSELFMGRKLRTNLPQLEEHLSLKWPDLKRFREKDEEFKKKQKYNYDHCHKTRILHPLPEETEVLGLVMKHYLAKSHLQQQPQDHIILKLRMGEVCKEIVLT